MRDQIEKIESESALHSARLGALGALTIDDIFDAFTRLLGDMAAMIGEPRTMTLDLPRLRSLPGWNR